MNLKLSIIVLILSLLVSCGKEEGEIKVGMLLHTSNSSRWSVDLEILTQKAEEMGLDFVMKDAGNDENIQLKQATELVQEGADVIIVVAASKTTAAGIVRTAHKNKIPVIAYDRLINDPELDYLVSFDYPMVGEMMVDYAMEKSPNKNSVILWGDSQDANAIFVRNGHEAALNAILEGEKPNILFRSYVESWEYKEAKHIVDKVLQFSDDDIGMYICSSINLALAAVDALKEQDIPLDDICITAQDASLDLVHSLLDGGVKMSVLKSIPELAETALNIAVELATNKKPANNQVVTVLGSEIPASLLDVSVLTKNNIKELLIDDGVFTSEQVYGSRN